MNKKAFKCGKAASASLGKGCTDASTMKVMYINDRAAHKAHWRIVVHRDNMRKFVLSMNSA